MDLGEDALAVLADSSAATVTGALERVRSKK